MNCNYCGKPGATKENKDFFGEGSSQWLHQSCFNSMPANYVFPPQFRKKDLSANGILIKEVNKKVKDGKFIL